MGVQEELFARWICHSLVDTDTGTDVHIGSSELSRSWSTSGLRSACTGLANVDIQVITEETEGVILGYCNVDQWNSSFVKSADGGTSQWDL